MAAAKHREHSSRPLATQPNIRLRRSADRYCSNRTQNRQYHLYFYFLPNQQSGSNLQAWRESQQPERLRFHSDCFEVFKTRV